MRRTVCGVVLIFLFAIEAHAAWEEIAPGVSYRRYLSKTRDIHVARVDLRVSDGIRVLATPEEDRNTTVSTFAARRKAIVAVNADFFNAKVEPVGLAVGPCGPWKGAEDNRRQAVVAFGEARVQIRPGPEVTKAESWMTGAVGGFPVLVRGCRALRSSELPGPVRFTRAAHPRTAVGFSRDERTMYLVVVDGRRPGVPGLTLPELAAWMRKTLKVCSALNLDGGGSSAMWIRDRIVNQPSDGLERRVANHLAVVGEGVGMACD